MKYYKYLLASVAVCLAVLVAVPFASAEEEASEAADPRGFYLGAAFGIADWTEFEENAFTWKTQVWWRALHSLALELSYVDLGTGDTDDGDGGIEGLGVEDRRASVDGWNFALMPMLPLGDTFTLYGKGGIFFYNADFRDDSGDKGEGASYGAGLAVDLPYGWGMRLEWEHFDVGDEEMDVGTLGGYYHFS